MGFCGFTGGGFNDAENTVIKKMSGRIAHRGQGGYYADEMVSFGFLKCSHNDTYTVIYDGALDNYHDLKTAIEAEGYTFETDTETEMLLYLYDTHGKHMLDLLRGAFAFLIYRHSDDEIFAARDFFGIKPFYYGIFDGQLVFGSEIKSFLEYPAFEKKLNHAALESYLAFQYSVLDETFFSGVFKLPAAHFLTFKNGRAEIERYWRAEYNPDDHITLEEAVEMIDNEVKTSVRKREETGGAIGSLLSGGVDSSYIAAVAEKIEKTFTVGFEYDGFNEIEHAKKFSDEIFVENISKIITSEEFWGVLPKIQYYMDEPLADPAAAAQYFACELAKQYVDIVFSGEGSDEFFGGYTIYHEPLSLAPLTRLPMFLRRFLGFIAKKIPFKFKGKNYFIRGSKTVEERFIGNANIFSQKEIGDILKNPLIGKPVTEVTKPFYIKAAHHDDITKMQLLDIHLWLAGDILPNADRMAAAHSLEMRVPYLDMNVFDIASKLPTPYRINKKACKYAFRFAAEKNFSDSQEKKRLGFPVPIRHWLKEEKYYNIVSEAFKQDFIAQLFNTDKLFSLLERHKSGKEDNSRKIWTVYTFAVWYGAFL